jgi:outer membrane protein assembly factor BamB
MAREPEVLYIGTGRHVAALYRDTGVEIWRKPLPTGASAVVSLLLKGKQLFVGHSGRVYCLDADTGRMLWENGLPKTGYNPVIMTMAGVGASTAFVAAATVVAAAAEAAAAAAG